MGEWVVAVRGSLSQEAFAAKIGANRTTIADWERGDNFPETPQLLGMIEMFRGAPELPGQRLLKNSTPESAAIAAMIAPLDEGERQIIQKMVQSAVIQMRSPRAKTAR